MRSPLHRLKSCAFLVSPFLSGLLLWLAFLEYPLFPLAWVALVPFLRFLLQRHSWKRVIVGHFLMAGLYFGGVLYWIPYVLNVHGRLGWPVAAAVFALMVLILAFFLLPFSVLVRWVGARSAPAALLCAPGFWLLTELGRNYYAVNGFPWALVGYSQYSYYWLIQIADLGGVYLVSFLVLIGNCSVAAVLRFKTWRPLLFSSALLLSVNLYGFYRTHFWQPAGGPSLRVALVQGNVALSGSREYYADRYFEILPAHYRKAVEEGAQWVIFPEARNPFFFQHDFYFTTFWERLVETNGAYLLFNSAMVEEEESIRYFNSAVLLDPEGRQAYRYDKVHLVPFGEYTPLKDWLWFAQPLVKEVSSFSAGNRLEVGTVFEIPFGTLICYESIFPELTRKLVQDGATILVNITNDSWFGKTAAPRQHLTMSAFRAIESRRPLLRCANSGYSAVIDPLGRLQQELGLFQEGVLLAEVAGNSNRPIYSYTGEWLNLAIIIVSFSLALFIRKGK